MNAKEKSSKSDKTVRALVRVGQAVSLAVERFVTVGTSIAEENHEIQQDMTDACTEAQVAGIYFNFSLNILLPIFCNFDNSFWKCVILTCKLHNLS